MSNKPYSPYTGPFFDLPHPSPSLTVTAQAILDGETGLMRYVLKRAWTLHLYETTVLGMDACKRLTDTLILRGVHAYHMEMMEVTARAYTT